MKATKSTFSQKPQWSPSTGLSKWYLPRLREYRLLTPSGHEARVHATLGTLFCPTLYMNGICNLHSLPEENCLLILKTSFTTGISIVDTPGILSGEKQRTDRGYDFIGVLEWFAERVDRILLLFDAHKLDISDEFKRSIEALRGHDDKIR